MKSSTPGFTDRPVPGPPRRLPPIPKTAVIPKAGSWRYAHRRRSRKVQALAIGVSVAFHAGVIFGFNHGAHQATRPVEKELAVSLSLTLADLKDLDEPDPPPTTDPGEKIDLGEPVPMQADQPQLPQPSDFVQEIDFASLVEQPDFSKAKVFSIPDHIRRTGKIGDGASAIFNLSELDRQPEPLVRPSPVYPATLKRDAFTATVQVEFVIDTDGRVINAYVTESTHAGFNNAAVAGVEKWKFRPGYRHGRRVKSRMMVPIVFNPAKADEN